MKKKTIITSTIIAFICQLFALIIILIRGMMRIDITALVPGGYLVDIMYFFLLSPLVMIIFAQFLSIFLATLFFKLQKSLNLEKYDYFIIKKDKLELTLQDLLSRASTLGIFAACIGTFLTNSIPNLILIPAKNLDVEYSFYILIASLLVLPYLILIFLPIWFLKDSGIKCLSKDREESNEFQKIPDIKNVYRIYNRILLGFISLCVAFALFFILINEATFLIETEEKSSMIVSVFVPFITIVIFLATTGISIIPIMISNLQSKKIKEKFVKNLTSQGVKILESINEI